jgi:hypothetical protein
MLACILCWCWLVDEDVSFFGQYAPTDISKALDINGTGTNREVQIQTTWFIIGIAHQAWGEQQSHAAAWGAFATRATAAANSVVQTALGMQSSCL